MEPGDFRLKPKKYAPLNSQTGKHKTVAVRFINILFSGQVPQCFRTRGGRRSGATSRSLWPRLLHTPFLGSLVAGNLESVRAGENTQPTLETQ